MIRYIPIPTYFLILPLLGFAQLDKDKLQSLVYDQIDSMPNNFVISIALVKNEKVAYHGFIKKNDSIIYTDLKDSLFEIGSLTKVFTASILAYKVENGGLNLTDRINKSFPYKFNDKLKFNYLELANHTSGLYRLPSNILPFLVKYPNNPYKEYSYELFDEYLKKEIKIDESNVNEYAYSNLGAGLISYALEKRYNKPLENLIKEHILIPYNLTKTGYNHTVSFQGIGANEEVAENWCFNALKGAGGIISSTNDLSKFLIAHFDQNNSELALTRKKTFHISENMAIGLGWHIISPNTENEKFWHNGGTGGYTSSMSFRTTNKTGVIILSNISALHPQSGKIDPLCFQLLDALK